MNIPIQRMDLQKSHKTGLITVGVLKIVIALASIACSTATVVMTKDYSRDCSYYYDNYVHQHKDDSYIMSIYSYCGTYYSIFSLSLAAQGIWTGCIVLISASLNIKFAQEPSKVMGYMSGGFSILSFLVALTMLMIECFPVAEGYQYYYNSSTYYASYISEVIWALHCALLSFAAALFTLTMTSVIISYRATGCSCGSCCSSCCCVTEDVNSLRYSGNAYFVPAQQQQLPTSGQPQIVFQTGYLGPQLVGSNYVLANQQPPAGVQPPLYTQGGYVGPQITGQAALPQQQVDAVPPPSQQFVSPVTQERPVAAWQQAPSASNPSAYPRQTRLYPDPADQQPESALNRPVDEVSQSEVQTNQF